MQRFRFDCSENLAPVWAATLSRVWISFHEIYDTLKTLPPNFLWNRLLRSLGRSVYSKFGWRSKLSNLAERAKLALDSIPKTFEKWNHREKHLLRQNFQNWTANIHTPDYHFSSSSLEITNQKILAKSKSRSSCKNALLCHICCKGHHHVLLK